MRKCQPCPRNGKDLHIQKAQVPPPEPDKSAPLLEKADLAEEITKGNTARMPKNLEGLSPEETLRMLQELQVHQNELEMQKEETNRVRLKLEESRDRYAGLYDFAPIGYFSFTEKALITEVNLYWCCFVRR